MSDNLVQFNLTAENPYWEILKSSNQLHITARQKHGELLELCRSKGVAFKDLENHLLKEAKKCGLYVATKYDAKTKKMVYPKIKEIMKFGWYTALANFIRWSYKNYYDYDLTNDERQKKLSKPKVSKAVIRTTDSKGNATEKTVEVTGATVNEVIGSSATVQPVQPEPNSITRPVDANMSLAQVQAIILRNFAVLGKICEDYSKQNGPGAIEAFNMLMLELGQDDEVIEYDEEKISLVA